MRYRAALVLAAAALASAGCHRREITSLERKEAANVASEGDFAVNLRDWARAEGLYAKAAALCPDQGEIWVNLGIVRMRMHSPDGARSAYKSALTAYSDDFDRDSTNSMAVLRKAYVLVILGRSEEAKALVDKAYGKLPEDRMLRNFIEGKGLDKLIADPSTKEISP
jgi:tetratricopeptide (TPR) repeat protein